MESILVALISGLCVAVPNMYATNKQSKKTNGDNEAIRKSMIILLRSNIVSKCEKYRELGYLPDYARSCICDLFIQYTALGGNHGVKVLVDETFKLPPQKEV